MTGEPVGLGAPAGATTGPSSLYSIQAGGELSNRSTYSIVRLSNAALSPRCCRSSKSISQPRCAASPSASDWIAARRPASAGSIRPLANRIAVSSIAEPLPSLVSSMAFALPCQSSGPVSTASSDGAAA